MHPRLGYFIGVNAAGRRKEVAVCGIEGSILKGEFGFNLKLTPSQRAAIIAAPKDGGYFKATDFPWLYEK